jgi:hypothetical protein
MARDVHYRRAGSALDRTHASDRLAGLAASFYGTIDGVMRNFHVGLAGLRAGVNMGTLTLSVLSARGTAPGGLR